MSIVALGVPKLTPTDGNALEWIPVRGNSMWPTLRSGDRAGLSYAFESVQRGNVVLARVSNALVIHRIVELGAGAVVLRGDNVVTSDPPVPLENVIAVVRQVKRGNRTLATAEWDRSPNPLVRFALRISRKLGQLAG